MKAKDMNEKILDVILEEATKKYAQEIADEELDAGMTEEDIRIMEANMDKVYKKTMAHIRRQEGKRRITVRRVLILAAAIGVALALSLNVSAWRIFLFKTYTDMTGSLLNLRTTSVDGTRYDEVTQFAGKDEMIIPDWLPPGMDLVEITDDALQVRFYYESEKQQVFLQQKVIISKDIHSFIETEKNIYGTEVCSVLGMEGLLVETRNQNDESAYKAVWSSNNVRYELFTNADKQMTEAILASLKFYQ